MRHLTPMVSLGLALAACGSGFTSSQAREDAGGAATHDSSADATDETQAGPGDSGADVASADAPHDSSAIDASADVVDEKPCAPVAFPLPSPCGGSSITGPGSVYLFQPQATPPMCFTYALSEAGTACEQCASTFTCACIDPDGGLIGVTCVNNPSDPYLSQN